MANKPSYAAVTANEASPKTGKTDQPVDAPPPYTGPSGSQGTAAQPVAAHHPHVLPHPNHLESGPPASGHGQVTTGWSPPPTPQVARSRAIRRFWMAFLYAWLIWVFVGFIVGGGVSDVSNEPIGRHGHWDKHGDWHGEAVEYSWFSIGNSQATQ